MLNNKADATKCVACEKARHPPAAAPSFAPSTFIHPKETPSVNGFGDKFKKSADKWSCGVCMVQNDKEAAKCLACQAENPNNRKAKPAAASPEKPKYTFGVIAAPPSAAPNKELFNFGAPPKEAGAAPSLGFVFGGAAAPKVVEQKNFAFGVTPPAAPVVVVVEEKKEAEVVAPPPSMMFAGSSNTAPRLKRKAGADDAASPPKLFQPPNFTFGAPVATKEPQKNPSFNFLTEEEEEKPKAAASAVQSLFGQAKPAFPFGAPAPAFGAPPKEPEKVAAPAKVDTPAPAAPASGFFNFAATSGGFSAVNFDLAVVKPKEAAPVFGAFGAPTLKSDLAPPKPAASDFGSFKPPAENSMMAAPLGGFAFGQSAAAPSFNFGAPAAKPAGSGFGEAPTPNLFGAVAAAPPAGLNVNAPAFSLGKSAMGGFNFGATANAPSVLQPIQQVQTKQCYNECPGWE